VMSGDGGFETSDWRRGGQFSVQENLRITGRESLNNKMGELEIIISILDTVSSEARRFQNTFSDHFQSYSFICHNTSMPSTSGKRYGDSYTTYNKSISSIC